MNFYQHLESFKREKKKQKKPYISVLQTRFLKIKDISKLLNLRLHSFFSIFFSLSVRGGVVMYQFTNKILTLHIFHLKLDFLNIYMIIAINSMEILIVV